MFQDCFRCGWGGRTKEMIPCPVCSNMEDKLATYIKSLHDDLIKLRKIARKAADKGLEGLEKEERLKIGMYS